MGQWNYAHIPRLPGVSGVEGVLKLLGYTWGVMTVKQNWERVWEKVETKLSKWNWLLPYLSYRARI